MNDFLAQRLEAPLTGSNLTGPARVITEGYTSDSFAVRAVIVFFGGLTLYNVVELLLLIFVTFKKYQGLYFWSLLVAGVGCAPYALGYMLKFLVDKGPRDWLAETLITLGWWPMVTGQSFVLWSRLHLVLDRGLQGRRILRWTLIMILVDVAILHVPTTILAYGANGTIDLKGFLAAYNVMEKIQMTGFCIQEVILSSIYIVQAVKLLKNSMREDRRRFMAQLVGINVIIILMDMGLVAAEAASLYLYETILKSAFYSIKLKLEFAILGKLVQFVGQPGTSLANDQRWQQVSWPSPGETERSRASSTQSEKHDHGHARLTRTMNRILRNSAASDSVNLSQATTNVSQATHNASDTTKAASGSSQRCHQVPQRCKSRRPGVSEQDVEFAIFQHVDGAELPEDDADIIDAKVSAKLNVDDGVV